MRSLLLLVVLIVAACGDATQSGPVVPGSTPAAPSPNATTIEKPTAPARRSPTPARPTPEPTATPLPVEFEVPHPVPLEALESKPSYAGGFGYSAGRAEVIVSDEGRRVEVQERNTGKRLAGIEPVAPVYGATVGFGSLWATDFDRDLVYRYDLESGRLVATIPVGRGPDAILRAAGSIWVADHAGGAVERIDPASNEVAASIVTGKPGRGGPAGMAVINGRLWVAVPIPGEAVVIDLASHAVVRRYPVPMYPCGVGELGDRVWLDQCSDTSPTVAVLARGLSDTATFSLPMLAFLAGRIAGRDWLLTDGILVAVDPLTMAPLDARSLDRPIDGVIRRGDELWLSTPDGRVRVDETAFAAGSR